MDVEFIGKKGEYRLCSRVGGSRANQSYGKGRIVEQSRKKGSEIVCNVSTTYLDACTRNTANIRDKYADQPVPQTRVVSVGNNPFSKIDVRERYFVQCYRALCVIKVLTL